MELNYTQLPIVLATFFLLLLNTNISNAVQSDIDCLKSIKASLQDPFGYLNSSWNFNNNTEGFICRFTGIDCWHPDENRVINIHLSDMGLRGVFPRGIANCKSLIGLELSRNDLYGAIPSDISNIIHYVTTLELSNNKFSGEIPVDLANCTYLNYLKLDNNRLTGQIPQELGILGRIKEFSVANNQLTGPIPHFTNGSIPAGNFAGNPGLCNDPLPRCPRKTRTRVIAGAAAAGIAVAVVAMVYFGRIACVKRKDDDPEGNKWAKSIKGAKGIKLFMFEKSVSKMRLSDLMKATNDFNKENIIGTGRTGTAYKALLEDGTSLMVKRLHGTQHSEKEFVSQMAKLGNVKHQNLVPLLGFCVNKKERLLVYKHMTNGTLHDNLHQKSEDNPKPFMEWQIRLKIAINSAKGFAWLHCNCNPRIIHRNISSKAILLDSDFNPKIFDFGLARLMNPINAHLTTSVKGKFGDLGYFPPEYARTLVATPKGDVYSFGVVLLELVTGEKPIHISKAREIFKGSLVEWITQLSGESRLQEAIDEGLVGKGDDNNVFQVLKVACSCVLSDPKEWPTMFEVYQFLKGVGEQYNLLTDDDILMPSDSNDAEFLKELIVAQEV